MPNIAVQYQHDRAGGVLDTTLHPVYLPVHSQHKSGTKNRKRQRTCILGGIDRVAAAQGAYLLLYEIQDFLAVVYH